VIGMNQKPHPAHHPSAASTTRLHWPSILLLGALGLVRPLVNIVEAQLDVDSGPAVPIILTIAVSAIWILIVGFRETPHPVLTLTLAGLVYGVLAIVVSGILSPILDGRLDGPLANPIAIVPMLALNAAWGLAAGAIALLIQRARTTEERG
jgi:hypothetical protein